MCSRVGCGAGTRSDQSLRSEGAADEEPFAQEDGSGEAGDASYQWAPHQRVCRTRYAGWRRAIPCSRGGEVVELVSVGQPRLSTSRHRRISRRW